MLLLLSTELMVVVFLLLIDLFVDVAVIAAILFACVEDIGT